MFGRGEGDSKRVRCRSSNPTNFFERNIGRKGCFRGDYDGRQVLRGKHVGMFSAGDGGSQGVITAMNGRSRVTIDPRIPTMPRRRTSDSCGSVRRC